MKKMLKILESWINFGEKKCRDEYFYSIRKNNFKYVYTNIIEPRE